MKYYLINLSHYCSFKVATEATNVNEAVYKWIKSQNAGKPKSDRLILIDLKEVTEEQYEVHPWSDETYYLTKYLNQDVKPIQPVKETLHEAKTFEAVDANKEVETLFEVPHATFMGTMTKRFNSGDYDLNDVILRSYNLGLNEHPQPSIDTIVGFVVDYFIKEKSVHEVNTEIYIAELTKIIKELKNGK